MAITIITQPRNIMPIHSPIMYLLSSTLSTEKNFKIQFEITINTEVRKVKVSARPDGKIEFDISSHLRDYLDLNSFNPSLVLSSHTDVAPSVNYQVTLNEEYIDSVTGLLIIGSDNTLATKNASNIVLNRSEQLNFQEGFYINAPSEGAEESNIMLNSKPKSTYFKDDVIWVHCVGLGFGLNRRFRLKEYDKMGTLLVTHPLNTMALFTKETVFYKLDLSTYSFNANTKSIGIEFLTNDVNLGIFPLTEENRYTLKNVECSSFDKYRLVYLDKLGSYNTISLNYASNEDVKIVKENFRSRLDPLSSSDNSRGLQTYFTKASEKFTLNTGNLNADDIERFEDMMLSTRVLLDVRDNDDVRFNEMEYVPFMVNTNTLRRYKSENQQIAQYTVDCELGYELNVRRR